jgi:hypothetical protein
MEKVFYKFPSYTKEIVRRVIANDWLVHSFGQENDDDVYNPAGYLYSAEDEQRTYVVHLDLNIYQYVLSAFKKGKKNRLHRDAIALLVFGKFTNISFDPTLAVYEKLNYRSGETVGAVVDELILFRKIDNADMESCAKFALGYTDEIEIPEIDRIDRSELEHGLTEHERLRKWDSLYLTVTEIIKISFYETGSRNDKFRKFIDWSLQDFIFSQVACLFAARIFGEKPLKKLMKFRLSQTASDRKSAAVNMTWDLFLLDKFIEYWSKKQPNQEFMFASNDKSMKVLLSDLIKVNKAGSLSSLENHISPDSVHYLQNVTEVAASSANRTIHAIEDFGAYRRDLIEKNECVLFST